METRFGRFNTNLSLAALALALCAGCQTGVDQTGQKKTSKDKEGSTIRLHLEVNADGTEHNHAVPVYRAQPQMVNINNQWFVNEGDIESAAVVDAPGGFVITLQFKKHGTLVLQMTTASRRGSRIAIFSQFGPGLDGQRWLAAPRIAQGITNGTLTFTPDATREEAERIVRGLNNVAKELKKQENGWFGSNMKEE